MSLNGMVQPRSSRLAGQGKRRATSGLSQTADVMRLTRCSARDQTWTWRSTQGCPLLPGRFGCPRLVEAARVAVFTRRTSDRANASKVAKLSTLWAGRLRSEIHNQLPVMEEEGNRM